MLPVMRVLGAGYANPALAAAVTIITKDGGGAPAITRQSYGQRIRIACYGAGVWVRLGTGAVLAATAGLNGEFLVAPSEPEIITMSPEWEWMSIINAGAGCFASAHPVDEKTC